MDSVSPLSYLTVCSWLPGRKEGEKTEKLEGKKNRFLLGWFPAGTNRHQGDEEEYSTGGQDDI